MSVSFDLEGTFKPVAGDWNGNGTDSIGFHRGDRFYLDVNGNGQWNHFAGGDAFYRFGNPGDEPVHIIEVQCGDYLGEDDIVRIEDNYGREGTNT